MDLFAALNTATGTVIGKTSAQHAAKDFTAFLDEIDRQVEPGLAVHLICDNLSVHKAPAVKRWLLEHPRVQLHFTPTYSSWLNQVERWFAELQRRRLDRGVFCSIDELTSALEQWIKFWNDNAKPFKWTKTADQIIDAHRTLLRTDLRTGTLDPFFAHGVGRRSAGVWIVCGCRVAWWNRSSGCWLMPGMGGMLRTGRGRGRARAEIAAVRVLEKRLGALPVVAEFGRGCGSRRSSMSCARSGT